MDKNIIVYGGSRCGKSSLAIRLTKKLNYSYISMDALVSAFDKGMPECSINHIDRSLEVVKNFQKFMFPYMKRLVYSSRIGEGYFVIDGVYLSLDDLIKEKFFKDFELIVLVYNDQDREVLFNKIRENDTVFDFTSQMTDDELLEYCDGIIADSTRIIEQCDRLNIKYYDVSNNREEVLQTIEKMF